MDKDFSKAFRKKTIFFISPDVKQAIGFEDKIVDYHIICSSLDPLIPILRRQGANIYCLEEEDYEKGNINNSGSLFQEKKVLRYIEKHSNGKPFIMYFKPSIKMDFLLKKYDYRPIGNSARLNRKLENKLFFHCLVASEMPKYAIKSEIGVFREFDYKTLLNKLDDPFVIQFGYGWAGKTTHIIKNENDFLSLQQRYKNTKIKASVFIKGHTYLNNCCIYKNNIFVSLPANQIDGINSLYKNPFVTCGRMWPARYIDKKQIKEIEIISKRIGKIISGKGYKGFFGLDFIVRESDGRIFLSEINARLTASTGFFTKLEIGLNQMPLLAYHMAQFMKEDLGDPSTERLEISGSQLIFRNKTKISDLLGKKQFGIYRITDKLPKYQREDYYPAALEDNEFIYIKRKQNKRKNLSLKEIERIETKTSVLKGKKQLADWVQRLIR